MDIRQKELLITSFGLFSLFFGAGNLLIPPLLGYQAGESWFLVTLGFMITAVVIPILGILAHARLQGTLFDFGKKVSKSFSIVYCILIYLIAVAIPSPRTAVATHEIAVFPTFGTTPLLTSTVYFSLVLVFVLNRTKILNIIGKFLTPFIVILLLAVIGIALMSSEFSTGEALSKTPMITGFIEGYQTFDAIASVVVGAVIIVSINFDNMAVEAYGSKRTLIRKSGFIAGLGLFVIYAGLIAVGAYYSSDIAIDTGLSNDMQRAHLLRGISISSLGEFGNAVLSVLIALACLTTAIGIVAGAADYFKGLFHNSQRVYVIMAVLACVCGVIVGQLDFKAIIQVGIPVLLFIYPITIILILLNILSEKWATPLVFRGVVMVTVLFSIPDVLGFLSPSEGVSKLISLIPLAQYSLGWVLPALCTFFLISGLRVLGRSSEA
ncbi:branched-chain amino acid transport system II carrier protein [Winogradskyella arenosi]|uniref:LIVCS family branched-chain amino acid:cation transporter n=1 Tax=Winogradskyella arenosi TaxID=533325 RepID=A0A368ZIW9_9FLAO|nr:branched-chain amino acid transport system II carrier protein [Winogradskyella arenosi]RCW93729.1 LIVCS family branched-chain amino acid:cation transporter [Winogradskyella arenosi]